MKKDFEIYEATGDKIPYEELTILLHKAYKKHTDNNLDYAAAKQDIETTKNRIGNGSCILIRYKDKLVGTITFKEATNKSFRWYERGHNVYLSQMAVDPDYSDAKVYFRLMSYLNKKSKECSYDACIADTSEKATKLTKHYLKLGYQIVAYKSWSGTNYYSYIFRKPINNGKVYSDRFCKIMFTLSKICCITLKKENGEYRLPFKIVRNCLRQVKHLIKK